MRRRRRDGESDLSYGVTYLKGCFRPSVISAYMTRGFEGSQVGATPIEEGMSQKTAREKLLMMRNGTPPDVGPPLRRGAYGVRL